MGGQVGMVCIPSFVWVKGWVGGWVVGTYRLAAEAARRVLHLLQLRGHFSRQVSRLFVAFLGGLGRLLLGQPFLHRRSFLQERVLCGEVGGWVGKDGLVG